MTEDAAEEHNTFASGSEALSAVVCSTMNSEDIEFSLNYQQAAFAPTIVFLTPNAVTSRRLQSRQAEEQRDDAAHVQR